MNRQNERSGFMKLEIYGRIIPSKLRLYYHIAVHCHGKCLVFIPCGSAYVSGTRMNISARSGQIQIPEKLFYRKGG